MHCIGIVLYKYLFMFGRRKLSVCWWDMSIWRKKRSPCCPSIGRSVRRSIRALRLHTKSLYRRLSPLKVCLICDSNFLNALTHWFLNYTFFYFVLFNPWRPPLKKTEIEKIKPNSYIRIHFHMFVQFTMSCLKKVRKWKHKAGYHLFLITCIARCHHWSCHQLKFLHFNFWTGSDNDITIYCQLAICPEWDYLILP